MGETVAQTLTEIEQSRASLEADIDELFTRLPARDVVVRQAKLYGGAAAGTAVLVAVTAVRAKRAADLRAKRHDARIHAEELARAFATVGSDEDEASSNRLGLAAIVAAIVGVTVAFLRARSA